MVNTVWNKSANEFLVAEVAAGHPTRICNYANIGHGQKNAFWEGVASAGKDRDDLFPSKSHPSGKTCNIQFDKLLAIQQDNKKNRKWKSGSTEDIGEVASGLEEIIMEMEEAADHADLDKEAKAGVAAEAVAQDLELCKGRVTPKAVKKRNVRPEPTDEPVQQKETLDSMLIKVLGKKAEGDNDADKERKYGMEVRKMNLKEEEFQEAKRFRIEVAEESRLMRQEARDDSFKRDQMANNMLKLALDALSKNDFLGLPLNPK